MAKRVSPSARGSCRHLASRRKAAGFTLIEMMIVVAIIAVLATLALVGYRKITQSSHVSEAVSMVTNIRTAQEAYFSETQTYANISLGLPTGQTPSSTYLYPVNPTWGKSTTWGAACPSSVCGTDWSVLPVHVDGPVYFGYATVAGVAGVTTGFVSTVYVNGSAMTLSQPQTTPFYEIAAEADLDGNSSTTTDVFGFSWSNQVFVSNEGL